MSGSSSPVRFTEQAPNDLLYLMVNRYLDMTGPGFALPEKIQEQRDYHARMVRAFGPSTTNKAISQMEQARKLMSL